MLGLVRKRGAVKFQGDFSAEGSFTDDDQCVPLVPAWCMAATEFRGVGNTSTAIGAAVCVSAFLHAFVVSRARLRVRACSVGPGRVGAVDAVGMSQASQRGLVLPGLQIERF
jgi:hypothetical protein